MTIKDKRKLLLTIIRDERRDQRKILHTLQSLPPSQQIIISKDQLVHSYERLEEANDYLKQFPNDPYIQENVAFNEDDITFWKSMTEVIQNTIHLEECLQNENGVELNV